MTGHIQFQTYARKTIKELNRLCELRVMEFQAASEWASPSFIMPKIDQTVYMISDFREVNKRLLTKPFPIPKIGTVLQELRDSLLQQP